MAPVMTYYRQAALAKTVPVFAALGDETRLRLVVKMLEGAPVSIKQLTEGTDITRQAVTRHLQVLAEAGLVRDVKAGRERLWEFDRKRLDSVRVSLDHIVQHWDQSLDRLKRPVVR